MCVMSSEVQTPQKPARHTPVCVTELIQHIPSTCQCVLDSTFGRGGHTQALLQQSLNIQVVGMDCDHEAIDYGKKHFQSSIEKGRLQLFHANFFKTQPFLKPAQFDVIVIDLGVSSPQLDQPSRGFSLYHDGPLDMRFDQGQTLTATDLLQACSEKQLVRIFQEYGEIKSPYKVVRAIFHKRKKQPIVRTGQLSSLIARETGWKKKGKHPATSYFRALRIAVNNELDPLEETLLRMISYLKQKGLLFVISFHSLEDRIVKKTFKNCMDLGDPLYKKVIRPSYQEQKANPRSRSAKLRIFQRL